MPGLLRDTFTLTPNSYNTNNFHFARTRLNDKAIAFHNPSDAINTISPLHKNSCLRIINQLQEENNTNFSEDSFYLTIQIFFQPETVKFNEKVYMPNGTFLLASLTIPKSILTTPQFFEFINNL